MQEKCVSPWLALETWTFASRTLGWTNTLESTSFFLAGYTMNIYMSFLPFPAWQKALQGEKSHTWRKNIMIYPSNLLEKKEKKQNKKTTFSTTDSRKNIKLFVQDSWSLEYRVSLLFNSVCHAFSFFSCPSHQNAAYLACGVQEGVFSHWVLQIRLLHWCLHFKALDMHSTGLQLPLGSIYMSSTADSFPECKRCIDRELRYKSFLLGASECQKSVKIEWG